MIKQCKNSIRATVLLPFSPLSTKVVTLLVGHDHDDDEGGDAYLVDDRN